MKETPLPTLGEMDELIAFLPRLYAEGYAPVKQWHGGVVEPDGMMRMPYPEYDEVVIAFYRAAAAECWRDYGYSPERAWQMLADHEAIKTSSLPQIKTMLTFCVRGERFSDGHWEEMIERGHIRRLLERLIVLRSQMG